MFITFDYVDIVERLSDFIILGTMSSKAHIFACYFCILHCFTLVSKIDRLGVGLKRFDFNLGVFKSGVFEIYTHHHILKCLWRWDLNHGLLVSIEFISWDLILECNVVLFGSLLDFLAFSVSSLSFLSDNSLKSKVCFTLIKHDL